MSGDKPLTPDVVAPSAPETAQEPAPREHEAAEAAASSTDAAADDVTQHESADAASAPAETVENASSTPEAASDAAIAPDVDAAATPSPETASSPEAAPEALADGQPPLPPIPPETPTQSPAAEPENLPTQSESAPPATPEEEDKAEPDDRPMGLMDHLAELRGRLVRCCVAVMVGFIACWAVVDPIFDALVAPLLSVLPEGSHAIYTTLPEGFFTRMHIAFVAGVFVSSPVIFYQIWSFIAPGLYDEEKRHIVPVAFMSAVFFISGGAFCYFVVFPNAFSFFVSYATDTIVAMPKVSDYLSFVLKLILAFGLVFEMPLFAFFLARMGIVTADLMRKVRRYAILGIFIVAAVLSPPDVVSQLLMAAPMLLLYEISILVAASFGKKSKAATEDEDAEKAPQDAATPEDAPSAEETAAKAKAGQHTEDA